MTDANSGIDMKRSATEHEMVLKSVEVLEKDIALNGPGLVVTDSETTERKMLEYRCSCGARFESGSGAYHHLRNVLETEQDGDSRD